MARKVTRKTFGVLILLVGIILGLLPFVPGVLIILVGLEVLGMREDVILKIKRLFTRASKARPVTAKVSE